MVDNLLRIYQKEIKQYPVLTREEEVELFKSFYETCFGELTSVNSKKNEHSCAHCREPREKIANANYRYVLQLALGEWKRTNHRTPLFDLIQEGNINLLRAIMKFDYTKGFKFSTYLTSWVRAGLGKAHQENASVVRISMYIYEKIGKYLTTIKVIERNNKETTIENIAEAMSISVKDAIKIKNTIKLLFPDPIETNQTGIDNNPIRKFLEKHTTSPVSEEVAKNDMNTFLSNVLDEVLDQREKYVLLSRYGVLGHVEKTLEVLGQEFSVTRERIRQIEVTSLTKVRNCSKADSLHLFLEDMI
jgi:RNA polymerase sigma factor (sigma-70 family)